MNGIERIQRHQTLLSIVAIILYSLAMLSPEIFAPGRLIGAPGCDADAQFAAWRAFAFENLSHGRIPEWNPHIFGGVPFLEGWQSSLFYPMNWIGLILPLEVALNLHLLIHSSIVGIGAWMWLRTRGCSSISSILGAIIVIGAGTWFARIYSGMQANLASMAWAPLMLWSIDHVIERPSDRRAMIGGIVSLSCTLLGGHPQYTYYLVLFSILYFVYRWIRSGRRTWRPVFSMSVVAIAALLLTAIQWVPSLDTADEFLRGRKLGIGYAAAYALPTENLITTVTPDAFGRPNADRGAIPDYWGRGFYWEASAYVGIAVLALAIVGATRTDRRRTSWAAILAIVGGVVLSVGYNTPLWELLYNCFPGWGQFRGMSKLLFYVSLIVALLAARGFDRLHSNVGRRNAIIGMQIMTFLLIVAIVVTIEGTDPESNGLWRRILERIIRSNESWYGSALSNPAASAKVAHSTLIQLLWTLPWFAAAFAATLLRGRWSAFALAIIALAGLVRFDRTQLISVPIDRPVSEVSRQALMVAGNDTRVIVDQMADQNRGMREGFESAWGVDPLVLKRWFEVLAVATRQNPNSETPNLRFREFDPRLMAMLRIGAVVQPGASAPVAIDHPARLAFVPARTLVIADRDQRLLTLLDPKFNPEEVAILESDHQLPTQASGTVRAEWINSDSLKLTADLDTRAAVVITNAYARGWSARSSSNEIVPVIPADHALQAVVLPPGHHEIILEYRARLLPIGASASALGFIGLFGLGVTTLNGAYRRAARTNANEFAASPTPP